MTQLPSMPYQSYAPVDALAVERGYLRALSICHYVWGGLMAAFSLFGFVYIAMGIAMATGHFPMNNGAAQNQPDQKVVGYIMAAGGAVVILVGSTVGILTILSGRRIAATRSRVFSFVVAGINCLSFPIGTTLGVFTFVLLSKERVRSLYEQ